MHRVKDHVSFLIRTGVAGDNLRATTDDDLVNIAPHPNLMMGIGRRTSAWSSGASQQASRQSGLGAGFPNHTPCVVVPPESAELPQAGRIAGQSQKGKDQDDETNS